jgi:nitrate/nitrite-specific signal transduction histidine kinase
MSTLWFVCASFLVFLTPICLATTASNEVDKASVISVNIDTISLDTKGLDQSLIRIEQQLSNFSQTIMLATSDSSSLTPQDIQRIQLTIEELHKSSSAMASLLHAMPMQVDQFNQQLPQLLKSFHLPITELATSLQLVQGGLVNFAAQAPSIITQAEASFEQSLDTLSSRLILIVVIILVLLFILIVVSIWGLNRHVIQPLSRTVAIMNSLPEQQLKTAELLNDISRQLIALDSTMISDSQPKPLQDNMEK